MNDRLFNKNPIGLIEASPDIYLQIDSEVKITEINAATEAMSG